MLDRLTLTIFTEQVYSTFRVYPGAAGSSAEMELIQVRDLGSSPQHEQFAAVFRGPLDPFLPQRIYRMEHDQLGVFDLFVVPVGQDAQGYSYEAVFNRPRI